MFRHGPAIVAASSLLFTLRISVAQQSPAQVPVGQAVTNVSCDDAQNRLKSQTLDEDDKFVLEMKVTQCEVKAHNQAHANDPSPKREQEQQISYFTSDPGDPKKVLFGTVSLANAKAADDLCKTLVSGYAMVAVKDPSKVTLIGAIGQYSCDAYYDAAVKSDPMLIVFPSLVPGIAITKEVLANSRNAAESLADYFQKHPEKAVLPLTPADQGQLLQIAGQAIGGTGGQALQQAGQALQKGQKAVEQAAGQLCHVNLFHRC